MTADESWRAVPGYEGYYEVSDLGRVKSCARVIQCSNGKHMTMRERILKTPVNSEGRPGTGLSRDGHVQWVKVQNLVAQAFIGNKPDGLNVCHINGDRTDNRVRNLRYDTSSSNALDRVRHGRDVNANKTHCPQGHAYDAVNTYVAKNNQRQCKSCNRRRAGEYAARKRAQKIAADNERKR